MGKVNHLPTQNDRILDYIDKHGSITQLEALRHCGVMRLASRISDMKRRGYSFESEMVTVTNQFGEPCSVKEYRIVGDDYGKRTDS
jgi:hypothetical protein